MAVIKELIRREEDGTISFGNYELEKKSKLSDFEHEGDLYKVKTFKEITKLERNGIFVYESIPGTAVFHLKQDENNTSFQVSGTQDVQITLELEPEKEYEIQIDNVNAGKMKTNLGGKLVLSAELGEVEYTNITVSRCE